MSNAFFIDQAGEVVEVAPDQAPAFASARGYVPASPQQISDFQTQQKYGTPGQAAIAGVEHAAGALTFGVSDVAERAAGVDPAAMAGREAANPGASMIGTGVGIVAPMVATLGADALPAGAAAGVKAAAKASAPSLISRAGEAVAAAAPEAIGKIGAKALQFGTEGALYGAANVVHEAALGDPNLTAQSAMASIGLSALLGGTLGAGVGTVEKLGGMFANSDFAGRVRSMLEDVEGHSNLNATNAMPAKVKAVLRSKGAEIGHEARDLGILKNPITDGPETILSRAQSVIKDAGEKVGSLTELADASGEIEPQTFAQIAGNAQAKIGTALRREGSTIGIADQVDAVFNRFAEAYGDRPMGVADIHALRQDLDNEIYKFGKSLDPFQKPTGQPLTRFRAHLTQEIEDGLTAGGQDVGAWKSANRAIEVGKTMEMLAESGVERSAANNALHLTGEVAGAAGLVAGGAPGAVLLGGVSEMARRRGASAVGYLARGLRNMMEGDAFEGVVNHTASAIAAERAAGSDTIAQSVAKGAQGSATIALLAKTNAAVDSKIARGIAAIAEGAPKTARGEVAAGVAHIFGDDAKATAAAYQRRADQLRQMAGDPALMSAALDHQTDGLQEHAPQTAQALGVASSRAVSFLASKLPQQIRPGPLEKPFPPTRDAMAKFHRYQEAVQNPLGVLRQAQAGTLTPEGVEALQAVYPALYAKIQGQIVGHLSNGKSIPYRQKLGLSMLLGRDLDGTLSGMAIARNQALFLKPPQAMSKAPAQQSKAMGKITLPDRAMTSSQRASGARER